MTKKNYITTHTKTMGLVLLSSSFFLLLFLWAYSYTVKQEKIFYDTSVKQYGNEMNSLLDLNSESYATVVTDITYWDELVDYIKTKKEKWFDTSILPSIALYNVDYIGVCDLKYDFFKESSTSKIKSRNFIPKAVMQRLNELKLMKFYMKLPEGLVEVYGATIHPSSDPLKKNTKPEGYFFMITLLDHDYFNNLEKLSNSKISFITKNNQSNHYYDETLFVNYNLNDFKNKNIAQLTYQRPFKINFKVARIILVIIIIAFMINLFFNLYFSSKWIFEPLKQITRILESDNNDAINALKKVHSEFGYIGNLFEENRNQKIQLQNAKLKAEESDQLKSSFLTNLSHEIRTPMNAIIGFSDLLENNELNDADKLQYINIIKQSGSNLVEIIEDLIEMSKIDAQQILPNYSSINLNNCLQELYDGLKIIIPKEKEIVFEFVKKSSLDYSILTDEIKLKQIIINLVTNAVKFTEQGYIKLYCEINHNDNTILFKVEDTGIGIEKSLQSIIFERFRKIEGDYAVKAGGLGLGLAISKAYVAMLGGTITVESKINEGSTFSFIIPLLLNKQKLNGVNQNSEDSVFLSSNNNFKTILIAEDDNINYLLIEQIMKLTNYTIIRAINGAEAVNICTHNQTIDLVLMDIKMPLLSGYEALEQIKKIRPELPIIAQTAFSSVEEQDRIKKAGFSNYITKPIDKQKLFKVINDF